MSRKGYDILSFFLLFFIASNVSAVEHDSGKNKSVNSNIDKLSSQGFVKNEGQISDFKGNAHPEVLYFLQADGVNIYFTDKGLSYYFYINEEQAVDTSKFNSEVDRLNAMFAPPETRTYYYRMDMIFSGDISDNIIITSSGESNSYSNYYLPGCPEGILNVKSYDEIRYHNVYNGIDFVFSTSNGKLKYDIAISPEADYKDIRLLFDGAEEIQQLSLDELLIKTPIADLYETIPEVFYADNHENENCSFELHHNIVSFNIPNRDKGRTLLIDPSQYWSTYFDYGTSTNANFGRPVFDSQGNIYNAGRVQTLGFPLIDAGGGQYFDNTVGGTYEVVVFKLNSSNAIQWSTYYGSTKSDNLSWPGRALAMDDDDNLYVLIKTVSAGGIFPTYDPGGGAFYQDETKLYDFYNSAIVQLDENGVRMWATVLSHESANTDDQDYDVWGISSKNNKIFITGIAGQSNTNKIPLRNLSGAYYDTDEIGAVCPFVGQFSNTGVLEWCTYFHSGNTGNTTYNGQPYDVQMDSEDNLWVFGQTSTSAGASLGHLILDPGGAFMQSSPLGSSDIIFTKFDSSLQPVWSSYYGGGSTDDFQNVTSDLQGRVCFVGYTYSSDFTTYDPGSGAYFKASTANNSNIINPYIVRFSDDNQINWATTYSDSTYFDGVEVGSNDLLYVTGRTSALTFDICNETGSYNDASYNGGSTDYVFLKFDNLGSRQWATYYGGSDYEGGGLSGRSGINVYFDPCETESEIIVFGGTKSVDFPTLNPGGGAVFQGSITNTTAPVIMLFHETTVSGESVAPTSASANPASVCSGTPTDITLTASGGTLGTGAVVQWYTGSCGGTFVGEGNPLDVSQTLSSSTTYYVRYSGDCNTTTCATVTVTINAIPTAIAGSNSPVCEGEDLLLTESGGEATSWLWSGPDSFSSTDHEPTISSVVLGLHDGTYELTITDANGCTSSDNINVTVNDLPATPIAAIDCSGGAGNGIITITSPTGAEYEYNIGSGYQVSPIFGSLDNGSYVVTVSNTTTACTAASNTIDMDCGCANPPSLTLGAASGSTCGVESETVSSNTFGGSATEVNLSHNGSGTLDATNFNTSPFSFIYTPVAADVGNIVSIVVTTDNPLGAPCTFSQETYSLTVNPIPSVIAGSNSPVCDGQTLSLTEVGGDAVLWSWSGPDDFTSTDHEPTISPVEFGIHNGIYEVTITDANGCTNSSDTDVIIPKPPTAVAGSNSPLCVGDDLLLTETGTDADTWSWLGPDGFISSDQDPTIAGVTTAADGLYSVTITDIYGCTADNVVDVLVNLLPVVVAGANSPVCEGEDINLTETGGEATSWSWTGTDGFSSSDQNPSLVNITTSADGTYTVEITDANGCINTDDVVVIVNDAPPIPTLSADCSGGEDNGIIEVIAPIGVDYEYTIDVIYQASTSFGPLTDGTYTVTVMNTTTGCTAESAPINLYCGCTNPPTLTLSSNTAEVCGSVPIAVGNIIFGGSATEVNLVHDGQGSLDETHFSTTPFGFNYITAVEDVGNTITITITTDNPEGAPCVPAEETFLLTIHDLPDVSAGSDSPVCEGEDLSMTETGGEATSWSWTGPDGFSSSDQNPSLVAISTSANGTYTVEITDANGCSNTDDVVVTVNDNPPIPTLSADCSGGEDNGIIEVTAPIGVDYEYTIDVTYQASTSFGPLTDGTYTVTVMNTTTDCTSESAPINLNCGDCVNPPTLTLSSSSSATCGLNSITISGNIFGGSASEVNVEHDGNGNLDVSNFTTSPFEFTYTPDALDEGNVVIITVTTDNPSGAPCTPAVEVFTLTVHPLPGVIIGSNSPVCVGEDIDLVETGGDADSWIWSGPDLFSSTDQNPTISASTESNEGVYFVTVTDINGCTATEDVTIQVITVSPSISDPGSFCFIDNPVNLEAIPIGGIWSGTGITDASAGIFDPSEANIGTNTIIYELSESGCTGLAYIDIQVYDNADASIVDSGDFCSDDDMVALIAANTGGTWTGDGVDPLTGIFDPVDAGTGAHQIIYSIGGTCGDADTIMITVYPNANATIVDPVDSLFITDPAITLTATDQGGEWSGNGIDSYSGEFNPENAGIGNHQIIYTIEQICGDADTIIIVVSPEQIEDLLIPDVVTANDDNYNDTWRIQGIQAFDDVVIYIFTRWGDEVFQFVGTGDEYAERQNQWDGTWKGKELPFGTYVYILELNHEDTYKGTVTLIR